MTKNTLDLKSFVDTLEPPSELVRIHTIEETETPLIVIAHCAVHENDDESERPLAIPIFTRWNPDARILILWIDLDLGTEREDGKRLTVLQDQANLLNAELESRVSKVSVYTNEDDDHNVATITCSLLVPWDIGSDEGLEWLRCIVSANMFRLILEATGTSGELHEALAAAGIPLSPSGGALRYN